MRSLVMLLGALLLGGCASTPPSPRWSPRPGPALERLLDLPRATAPALSPDGRKLAFLSDLPGLPQPFVVDNPPGPGPATEPRAFTQLARLEQRVQELRFRPDGRSVLLGYDRGGDENMQLAQVQLDTVRFEPLTEAPAVRHLFGVFDPAGKRLAYGSNARSKGDFDVMLRDLSADTPARIAHTSRGHIEPRAFSADGRKLLLIERRSSSDHDLHLLDVDTGARSTLTPHQGEARYEYPCFAAGQVLTLTDQGRDFLALEAIDPASGRRTPLLELPHDVDHLACATDRVAVAVNTDGRHTLRLFRVEAGPRLDELPGASLPPGVIRNLALSDDGGEAAVQLGRASEPDHLWTIHTSTGATRQRTQVGPALAGLPPMAEPTLESAPSFDGLAVPLFLYRPPAMKPGERAPVVVWVHGGPESQFQPSFSPLIQALVGRGYLVAAPNVRGSTGYGKRYSHLDDVERREDSVADLAAVNRWLRTRPDVLADRIAVMGGSYGGYMVLASLTLHPELWAAGCDVVGIASFRTFLERTAPYRRAQREAEYGSLSRHGELLDRLSPLGRVDKIRAPLFVIHGANDPRVPVHEAEQIVEALRRRQSHVTYLRFDDEGHGLTRRKNQITAYSQVLDFLDAIASR